MDESKTSITNPASKRNYLFPSIAGIAFIVIILLLVIFFPCPTSSQYVVFRIVLSIALSGFAAIVPGFFTFQYKTVVTAGGAIAVFAFTYIFNPALIDTSDKCNQPFDFTVFIEDSTGTNPLKNRGKLILLIENDKREENIDDEGSANFKQLPNEILNHPAQLQLEADGWVFDNGKRVTEVNLQGKSSRIIVKKDNSLCCVSGSVRDQKNGFIGGVKVNIGDVFSTTDENGRFNIELPSEKQKDEQRLTAYKKGFKIWEDNVFPATKQEVEIILIQQ